MSASTNVAGARSKVEFTIAAEHGATVAEHVAAAADPLGVAEAAIIPLIDAGLLRASGANGAIMRRDTEDLAERIWRAALPTGPDAPGVRLRDAVAAFGGAPRLWATVVAALLDGRLNAFRRRGGYGEPLVAGLIFPSEHLVANLATSSNADIPFIWTPTGAQN